MPESGCLLAIRDRFLNSTRRVKDPHRRVLAICRLAEAARKERPEKADAVKRACFHACLEALKARRGKLERKKVEGMPPV